MKIIMCLLICTMLLPIDLTWADDVTDTINEAVKQYEKGDYMSSINSLDYASGLIRQKRGQQLESFLPGPLDGWTAEDATYQAAGTAMLGGGVSAEGRYYSGNGFISVNIVTDSPMLQGVLMMLNNPLLISTGGKILETIKGHRAVISHDPRTGNGEINVVIANRVLVSVKGSNVSRDELRSYADSVDYKGLTEFAQVK